MRVLRGLCLLMLAGSGCGKKNLIAQGLTENFPGLCTLYFHAAVAGHADESWAIEVVGHHIERVGPSDALLASSQTSCQRVDLAGAFVQPGFHDAHAHLYTAGAEADGLVLLHSELSFIQPAVRSWARQHPDDVWLLGRGWSLNAFPAPHASLLDEAEAARPVVLIDHTGHNVWTNSIAMKTAGITASTPDPLGGHIARDASGNATGLFLDTASELILSHAPAKNDAQNINAILNGERRSLRAACTSSQGGPLSFEVAQLYQRLDAQGLLKQRTFLWAPLALTQAQFEQWVAFAYALPPEGLVQLGGFKGFVDGTLAANTAALLTPYADQPENSGTLYQDSKALVARIRRANFAGFPVMLHAVGDAGVRQALDAYEASASRPSHGKLNRIEHVSLIAPSDVPRFLTLAVGASIQPVWLQGYSSTAVLAKKLGQERLAQMYAFKQLADAGALLLFGSDLPASDLYDPLLGLWAATSRQLKSGKVFLAAEALSFDQAMAAYTVNPAIALGAGARLGKLDPGFEADFIVLHHDPRSKSNSLVENPLQRIIVAGREIDLK